MGYTIFIRPQVTPRTIMVPDPCWEPDPDLAPLAPPPMVEQLNPVPPQVYPSTFGKRIWACRSMDDYSENAKLRGELWEDSEGTATYADILAMFPELPRYVEIAARKWGSAQLANLVNPYQGVERETWHVQQREAEAWQADPNTNTPMITALAAARGITVADLVAKIMENVNAFRIASGRILGRQQALIDQGYQALDMASLLAICDEIGIKLMEV